MSRTARAIVAVAAVATLLAGVPGAAWGHGSGGDVHPGLRGHLVAHYDFDHPVRGAPAWERDRGRSGTAIELVNGGAAMRVPDRAYPGSGRALRTRQVNPAVAGADDWKAGIYAPTGVPSLRAFNAVRGTTIMGWFTIIGEHPAPNSNTPNPADRYNATGLAGLLTGDSEGHAVRALLEVITVGTELRLVALGRRLDGGASQTFAASADWRTLLPVGEWVFLAATFDFDDGTMALYRNGRPLDGFYVTPGDPWLVSGPCRPGEGAPPPSRSPEVCEHHTTATDPRGIKIGGSFPQDTAERNPCDCRMDALMFLDRVLPAHLIERQYRHVTRRR
jgi:hypothetical protein